MSPTPVPEISSPMDFPRIGKMKVHGESSPNAYLLAILACTNKPGNGS